MAITLVSPMKNRDDLSMAYTPGIADVVKLIQADEAAMFTHTFRRNNLAIITDGSAVLGLGNVGHKAAYPVMEGKAMLFKKFANIDAIPIVVNTQDVAEFVSAVVRIADSFAAINLEDIAAPHCFEIERQLADRLNIPLMHDDQHGTAVVVLAAILNALELVPHQGKKTRIVLSGAGAAGIATAKLLAHSGFVNVLLVDSKGILSKQRTDLTPEKELIVEITNPEGIDGSLADALKGAGVFIGVSRPGILTGKLVKTMAKDAVIIAMANPVPEIWPDEAKAAGAAIVCTGRSDYPNQVNNALAFPGIFRAAINQRAKITEAMKVAAAEAIREYHKPQVAMDNLLPSILDPQVHSFIAEQVAQAC
jgi:malate dehydrogenase (oxaloacetate-decarboxylating)